MRVLGVDPGLAITGYGIVDVAEGRPRLVEGGVIRSEDRDAMEKRVGAIFSGMLEILDEFRPDVLAMEDLYSHYKHPKTAIIMGHARGAVMVAAEQRQVPVRSYGATKIKSALTGNGRAKKEQVRKMVLETLGGTGAAEPVDAYDALAAALCHINHAMKAAVR